MLDWRGELQFYSELWGKEAFKNIRIWPVLEDAREEGQVWSVWLECFVEEDGEDKEKQQSTDADIVLWEFRCL